jgi:hypothetical protein
MEVINDCAEISEEEKLPRYIESICRALNIKNEQELNQLLSLFDKHNQSENKQDEIRVTEESNIESGEEKNREDKENSLIIDPDMVLDLLKEFYNEKKIKSKEQSKFFNFNLLNLDFY